jgi:hypothetical protein
MVGVSVGGGGLVLVGCGVTVGVQVGAKTWRGVGVAVGKEIKAGIVGGGNGLKLMYGLTKIATTARATHRKMRITRTVSTFHARVALSRDGRTASSV